MKQANGNYIRPPARFNWWLKQGMYFNYMMRELSSLFVGLFSLLLVWGLFRLSQGEAAFTAWSHTLWHNLLWLNILILLFAVYHSYTWFMVTPKAMPIKVKGKRLAPSIIIGAHMLLWMFCSIFVWLLFIYGGAA